MKTDLAVLQASIGYSFRDPELLRHALRHSSYTNEHNLSKNDCNERMEFLGDAVLETVCSDFLYRMYPDVPEGELTKMRANLVCEPALAFDARAFSLQDYILLGRGEEITGGRNRDSIVSDACEALIGAIYLDGGMTSAEAFILSRVLNDHEQKTLLRDSKSALQEMTQGQFGCAPEYRLLEEKGPAHNRVFSVQVLIDGKKYGTGSGKTKKAAEQMASYEAVKKLNALKSCT